MNTLAQLYDAEKGFFTLLIQMVNVLRMINVKLGYMFTEDSDSSLVMNVEKGMKHSDGKQALAFSKEAGYAGQR